MAPEFDLAAARSKLRCVNGLSDWTLELDVRLVALRSVGKSASQIGEEFGKSRSAILGRIRRLGLAKAAVRLTPEEAARRRRACKEAYKARVTFRGSTRPMFTVAELQSVQPERIALLDLSKRSCRWPYGDGPFTFCGCRSVKGKSYCAPHLAQSLEGGVVA